MQMEWCNQFDSSIRIHQRQRVGGGERQGGDEGRLLNCALIQVLGFSLYSVGEKLNSLSWSDKKSTFKIHTSVLVRLTYSMEFLPSMLQE